MSATTSCGITKEMWTCVVPDGDGWMPTDIFYDTPASVEEVLAMVRRNYYRNLDGVKLARCIVTIYPPE